MAYYYLDNPPHDGYRFEVQALSSTPLQFAHGRRCVRARPNIYCTVCNAPILTVGIGLLVAAVAMIWSRDIQPFWLPLWILGGIGLIWVFLSALTARHRVDLDGFEKWDVWGHRTVPWSEVRELWVNRDYFGSDNINLAVRGSWRHVILFSSLVGNRVEFIKAIIEAATTANPSIVIRGTGIAPYGDPPYGIFERAQHQT